MCLLHRTVCAIKTRFTLLFITSAGLVEHRTPFSELNVFGWAENTTLDQNGKLPGESLLHCTLLQVLKDEQTLGEANVTEQGFLVVMVTKVGCFA